MIVKSITELVGNTPMVELRKINPNPRVRILAKLEKANASGSVKDRVVLRILEQAEKEGRLKPGDTVIEATSGNTGISLAWAAAAKGYKAVVVLPENASRERVQIARAYGAQVVLTPAKEYTDGAMRKARELAKRNRWFYLDQFNNPLNAQAHEQTALEILEDAPELTHFVAGSGTFGTLNGVASVLKRRKPHVQVIGVEPEEREWVQGLKNSREFEKPGLYEERLLSERVLVPRQRAVETARLLAKREGLFVGESSGAAVSAAVAKARELKRGTLVVLLADGGERYLSSGLVE